MQNFYVDVSRESRLPRIQNHVRHTHIQTCIRIKIRAGQRSVDIIQAMPRFTSPLRRKRLIAFFLCGARYKTTTTNTIGSPASIVGVLKAVSEEHYDGRMDGHRYYRAHTLSPHNIIAQLYVLTAPSHTDSALHSSVFVIAQSTIKFIKILHRKGKVSRVAK